MGRDGVERVATIGEHECPGISQTIVDEKQEKNVAIGQTGRRHARLITITWCPALFLPLYALVARPVSPGVEMRSMHLKQITLSAGQWLPGCPIRFPVNIFSLASEERELTRLLYEAVRR